MEVVRESRRPTAQSWSTVLPATRHWAPFAMPIHPDVFGLCRGSARIPWGDPRRLVCRTPSLPLSSVG